MTVDDHIAEAEKWASEADNAHTHSVAKLYLDRADSHVALAKIKLKRNELVHKIGGDAL